MERLREALEKIAALADIAERPLAGPAHDAWDRGHQSAMRACGAIARSALTKGEGI